MSKQNEDNIPDIEKDGWEAEELAEEAANKEDDEIVRELKKADQSEDDPERVETAPIDAETTYQNDEEE